MSEDHSEVPTGAAQIEIVGGNPSPLEVAAVTAVLAGVLEELSGLESQATTPHPSAWERSQRPIRLPVHPGPGHWRGFSG